MKHRALTVMILCLALLLAACQQVTPPPTDGTTTEPTGTTGSAQLAHTHKYVACETVGNCTEDGYTMMRCDCGVYYRGNIVKAPGHDYRTTQIVAPTPTENGYTVYTCSRCGDSYNGNETVYSPPEPTEPDVKYPAIQTSDWQPAHQPLSYEAFFGTNRAYKSASTSWYTAREGGFAKASVQYHSDRTLLVIVADGTSGSIPVPNSEGLADYTLIFADGVCAYLTSNTQILRINLSTGERKILVSADWLSVAAMQYTFIYRETNGDITRLCQIYLPTETIDILVDNMSQEQADLLNKSGIRCSATQSPIFWEYDNPEMLNKLQSEVNDPDSPYRKEYPYLWESTEPVGMFTIPAFTHQLQTDFNIPAFIKQSYDPVTKKLSTIPGFIDTCWYGSGYPHDHYDPNTYDLEPVWKVTDPVPLSNMVVLSGGNTLYDTETPQKLISVHTMIDSAGDAYLCRKEGYLYKTVLAVPITSYTVIEDMIFCTTKDHKLVQITPEGSTHVLYTAESGSLRILSCGFGYLYLLNDNLLLELDLPKETIRQLAEFPHFRDFYFDGPQQLYIWSYKGMSVAGFVCDFAKLTIRNQYRL